MKRYLPFLDGQAMTTVLTSLVTLNARISNPEWLQAFCQAVRACAVLCKQFCVFVWVLASWACMIVCMW